MSGVHWKATRDSHPARDAALASMDAVSRAAKDEWLSLFAADAVVEDPVGPSAFDPDGKGHHGREAISAFWETAIAQAERIEFSIDDSFACGNEVANVGTITTHLPDGSTMDAEGVFSYRVDDEGRIKALRAFWEFDRAVATLR
ncbi:nuclear transport factor 2 family protein [Saccharopolyspora rhizosphaerae]|uniref:Nuclear transport factor 2 family protein n=1 Tax=Saccharopolyspora rhizosphaerae TaxID=2492662 RepID=A0A3R8QQR1_9PSEU|nr:nuclear transport factor 2 family protein [Saccharopolyspora rhizosphaerae]RRO17544.1 nuclear transport factor 2 family protein [Saccharopolyspora rhizosphaerae]